MTASTLPFYAASPTAGQIALGISGSNAYAFNPGRYVLNSPSAFSASSPGFTPLCTGTTAAVIVSSVSTAYSAATAYDWFSLISASTGTLMAAYTAAAVTTTVGVQNKAFVASLAYEARLALLPLVKAEYFLGTLAPPLITTITNEVSAASNSLTTIQTAVDSGTKTAIAACYTAEAAVITAALNRLKTIENKIYLVGDSIDVTSTASNTAYAAIATLTSFTGTKVFLSNLFDPAILGNGGTAIPALTASTFANAATLQGYYATSITALAGSTMLKQMQATTEMTAQYIFDGYCSQVQGYLSVAGTTGTWSTGSATIGIIPGIDFEIHGDGTVMSAQVYSTAAPFTAVAGAGGIGAPSVTTLYI
jgi:hypothetical protein